MASLILPNATVTQEFGCTGFYLEPARGNCAHFHEGVDYGVPTGTPILAPGAGRIVQAGPNGGYGNSITVDLGNGLTVLLGHLSAIAAHVGDAVAPGQRVGLSGSTGASTAPHLHFEARRNGQPVDPRLVIAGTGPDPLPPGGHDTPIIGGLQNAADGINTALGAVSSFLGQLTQPDTWMRVALVVGGVGLIAFGAWYLASVPDDGQ